MLVPFSNVLLKSYYSEIESFLFVKVGPFPPILVPFDLCPPSYLIPPPADIPAGGGGAFCLTNLPLAVGEGECGGEQGARVCSQRNY